MQAQVLSSVYVKVSPTMRAHLISLFEDFPCTQNTDLFILITMLLVQNIDNNGNWVIPEPVIANLEPHDYTY